MVVPSSFSVVLAYWRVFLLLGILLCYSSIFSTVTAAAATEIAGGPTSAQPWLVMGLPRSGGLALHEFFQCNGFKSSHYCCGGSTTKTRFSCGEGVPTCGSCVHDNMLHERPPFAKCGDYQVYSQFDVETGEPYAWFLPQHFTLPLLHQSYPQSVWILNTRGQPEQWADNVLHWYSVTQRMFNSFGLHYYSDMDLNNKTSVALKDPLQGADLFRELDKSLARAKNVTEHLRRRDLLMQVYQNHTARVREFVRNYPSHRLVEINVDDPQAGRILAQAWPSMRADCWKFDAPALDNDWKDFSLKV